MDNRKTKVNHASHVHELGENHNNSMAHTNGMDEIDRWAMGCGQAEQKKHSITPQRKHVMCNA